MFWFFIFLVFVVIVIAASSASNAAKASSIIQSMASMMSSEARFREYWRFMHTELTGRSLPKEQEDKVVQLYLAEYLELLTQIKTITPDNVQAMLPAFVLQSDNLDFKIAQAISASFGNSVKNKRRSEKAAKKYARNVLGIKI